MDFSASASSVDVGHEHILQLLTQNIDSPLELIYTQDVREIISSTPKRPVKKDQRKRKQPKDIENEQRLLSLKERRDLELKDKIGRLSEESVKDLLYESIKRQPGMIFSILEEGPVSHTGSCPSWCTCSNCKEMPTIVERLCCGKIPEDCVANTAEMECIITEPSFLSLANSYRNDVFGINDDEDHNRSMRHNSYRQFTIWRHQYLGAGNRKPIPSCCVWKIRNKFPSISGTYTGFKSERLA